MSFDWQSYLALAKTLNAMSDEAAWRSAVSRAYYSAFHAASSTLKANTIATFPKDERKSHAKVWNVYTQSAKKDCRRIGNRATRIMDDRLDADYNAARVFKAAEVTTLINETEALVTAIGVPQNLPEGYTGPHSTRAAHPLIRLLKRAFGP